VKILLVGFAILSILGSERSTRKSPDLVAKFHTWLAALIIRPGRIQKVLG
jgi:hypothetical protein